MNGIALVGIGFPLFINNIGPLGLIIVLLLIVLLIVWMVRGGSQKAADRKRIADALEEIAKNKSGDENR